MLFASNAASSLRSPSNKTFFSSPLLSKKDQRKPILFSNSKPLFPLSAFKIGPEDICEIAHNKVLVASALSCAIGQLSKSLFWAFNGAGIDLSAAVRSGGMPSTHSAGVAAAATSLALERGFSDPVFGMSVVIAALVMYDAQGVRREVGHHAKIMNKLFKAWHIDSKSQTSSANSRKVGSVLVDSSSAAVSSLLKPAVSSSCFETLQHLDAAVKEDFLDKSQQCCSCSSLNESVGHTGIEVCAGAFLGFFPSSTGAGLPLAVEVHGGNRRAEVVNLGKFTGAEVLAPAGCVNRLSPQLLVQRKDEAMYAQIRPRALVAHDLPAWNQVCLL